MGKFFDRALDVYSQSELDLQLKARFFFIVCLVMITLCAILIGMSCVVQILGWGTIDVALITTLVALLLAVFYIYYNLVQGRFYLAAHIIVSTIIVIDWIVLIIEHNHPVARLNSIVYSVAILSLLPLVIKRRKWIIFVYGGLNILFLFLFSYFAKLHNDIPMYAVIDFISDNTIATFVACFVANSV